MMEYLFDIWVNVIYYILLLEIIYDFFDCFKFLMCGYVFLDYEIDDYWLFDLVKIDIFLNGDCVDVLSFIFYCDFVEEWGCEIVFKFKKIILW